MGESKLVRGRHAPSRWASFRFAWAGCRYVFRRHPNSWLHAAATSAVLILGWWLDIGRWDWAVLALAIGIVWVAEMINTAIEAVVDLASPNLHPLAKVAKDVAAAAVLAAALTALIVGLLILGPPLWERIVTAASSA
jgi:diacylglycerol kinase